jgi:hypothetical protein
MFQFTIIQIKNGFVVQHPNFGGSRLDPNQQQQPPITQYCSDYKEVVNYLKQIWPLAITD